MSAKIIDANATHQKLYRETQYGRVRLRDKVSADTLFGWIFVNNSQAFTKSFINRRHSVNIQKTIVPMMDCTSNH